ncbi:MAG: ECF transporter S component [Propionibacteriaceae bacterium]|jgi:energy-coupling factor transport system substrate-specific component|nr:ECF transporter S component [Propionibacteriaceae bacterium]
MDASFSENPTRTGRFRWRVVDIIVAAILGVAVGVIFVVWNFAGDTLGDILKAIFPPLKGLLGGMWLLGGVLGGLIIRKPGAALFVELVAALVPALVGNQWGITTLISGTLQGLGAELVFLLFAYRVWRLPVAMLAGILAAGFEWVYEILVWYAGWQTGFKVAYLGTLALSGVVLAGFVGWLIQKGLARTGVLNRFESGREGRTLV